MSWKSYLRILPMALLTLVAIFGPALVPYSAADTRLGDRLLPPGGTTETGAIAILGTDDLGRDLAAQIIAGTQISLMVGGATILIAATFGTAFGLLAGYRGGVFDAIFVRLADTQLAFPSILFALLLVSSIGPGLANVIFALALTRWVVFARVARSSALTLRPRSFISAAWLSGSREIKIIWRHILPNALPQLLVVASVEFGLVIVAEASLSFLGVGTPVGTPSWGRIISNGRGYIDSAWWLTTFPGLAIIISVLAFSVVELLRRAEHHVLASAKK